MNPIIKILGALGLIIYLSSLTVIGDYTLNYSHELVHKTVYDYHGITSTMKVLPFFRGGYTIKLDDKTCDQNCKDAHLMAEIVGYHIAGLIFNLWLICMFITIIIMLK